MERWRKRERDRKMEKVTWKDRERERAIERWKKRHGMIETERDRKLEKKTKVLRPRVENLVRKMFGKLSLFSK